MSLILQPVTSSAAKEWGYDEENKVFGVIYESSPDKIYLYHGVEQQEADEIFELGNVSVGGQALPYLKGLGRGSQMDDADLYRAAPGATPNASGAGNTPLRQPFRQRLATALLELNQQAYI